MKYYWTLDEEVVSIKYTIFIPILAPTAFSHINKLEFFIFCIMTRYYKNLKERSIKVREKFCFGEMGYFYQNLKQYLTYLEILPDLFWDFPGWWGIIKSLIRLLLNFEKKFVLEEMGYIYRNFVLYWFLWNFALW